jgi:hypothetical protein
MSKPILSIYEEHIAPVVYRQRDRLRRQKVYGEQVENKVWVDPRQDEEEYLDSLLHEMLHFFDPEGDEDEIRRRTAVFSCTLWKLGYRRVKL